MFELLVWLKVVTSCLGGVSLLGDEKTEIMN